MEEIKELRPKDDCEQQLAVELAVGAVDSIDSLIDQGHEIACEYACQLLFDNLRKKVAARENLPVRIVQHLLKDRCIDVRLAVTRTNWKLLTTEQQEEIIHEAELLFDKKTYAEKERTQSWSSYQGKDRQMKEIIGPLLKTALLERNEPAALRYIKILGLYDGLPLEKPELIPALKDMPEVFRAYWEGVNKWYRRIDAILAHPDENARMEEVQKILKKKTRVSDLYEWQNVVARAHIGENFKGKILEYWIDDPSEKIRLFIAENTTNVEVLEMLATDESNKVSRIAYPRYKKFQKRAAYSKAYQEKKKEKLRQERGW